MDTRPAPAKLPLTTTLRYNRECGSNNLRQKLREHLAALLQRTGNLQPMER